MQNPHKKSPGTIDIQEATYKSPKVERIPRVTIMTADPSVSKLHKNNKNCK